MSRPAKRREVCQQSLSSCHIAMSDVLPPMSMQTVPTWVEALSCGADLKKRAEASLSVREDGELFACARPVASDTAEVTCAHICRNPADIAPLKAVGKE